MKHCGTAHHSFTQPGLALTETLIVTALLGIISVVGGLVVETTRNELKRRQVWAMLETLDKAVTAYRAAIQTWPTPENNLDDSADPIIALLQMQPASRDVLQEIPAILRVPLKESWTVQDAWGHRVRCLTDKSSSSVDRQAVVANDNKPIFVSTNVGGEFLSEKNTGTADNLRSDELPRPCTIPRVSQHQNWNE
jgi:type II secretory pathway pseudopilin PulG